MMDFSTPKGKEALVIAKRLHQAGFEAYFAGGCVRDYLLAHKPSDYDIATAADPDAVEALFEKTVPVGKQFGVVLVVSGGMEFEVATFRTEGLYRDGRRPSEVRFSNAEEDAKRRDFTVNGLFYDPSSDRVIDYVGGKEDLKQKIIRAIGDPRKRFDEDKLRLLRAVRFGANLGFEIESATWAAVKEGAAGIKVVSRERISEELSKMLTRPGASRGISLLGESGLLAEIFPEEKSFFARSEINGKTYLENAARRAVLIKGAGVSLALASLFYDVKKIEALLSELRFSKQQVQKACRLIRMAKGFPSLPDKREAAIMRVLASDDFKEASELFCSDCEAKGLGDEIYVWLKQQVKKYQDYDLKPAPYLSGDDLKSAGFDEGPRIRENLDEAYDLQLEGVLKSREDALMWLQEKMNEK